MQNINSIVDWVREASATELVIALVAIFMSLLGLFLIGRLALTKSWRAKEWNPISKRFFARRDVRLFRFNRQIVGQKWGTKTSVLDGKSYRTWYQVTDIDISQFDSKDNVLMVVKFEQIGDSEPKAL